MVFLAVPFGLSRGYGPGSAVIILTAFNLTNGFSRLIMGYLSDNRPHRGMSLTFLGGGRPIFFSRTRLAGARRPCWRRSWLRLRDPLRSAPLAVDCFGLKHFGAIFGLIFTAYGLCPG